MGKTQRYQAVRGTDDDQGEERPLDLGEDVSQTQGTRARSTLVLCVAALFSASLVLNIFLLIDNAQLRNTCRDNGKTKYSKFNEMLLEPF